MRIPTSKRTRFEVFKRDHFTCQYCGAQPPNVVLVVDHIEPVCKGGESGVENLITACEACNQGKAGTPLSHVPIRPDADLLYLETQQEIAELRRYQKVKAERDAILDEIVDQILETWFGYLPDTINWHPSRHIIRNMLDKYPPDIVETGLTYTAKGVARGTVGRSNNHWLRYAWAMMRYCSNDGENDDA